jgi:hypothetical protein
MDMGKEAIEKIEELVNNGRTVTVDDTTYSPVSLHPVIYTPRAETLEIHSLLGFCVYINNGFDSEKTKTESMVVVNDIESVDLVSKIIGKDRKRENLISATLDDNLDKFPFGEFMSQEEFAIRFRSSFVQKKGDDTEYILRYASKLSGSTTVELEDDGVTQNVGVKAGVSGALVEKKDMKPIVKLSPYRTFREIEQPESEFLFRARIDANNVPKLALFEADGGAWRNTAMTDIAKYISDMCADIKIIA